MKKLTLFIFALFCASSLSAQIPAETKLYLNPAIWQVDNARFAAYFFGSGGDTWVSMSPVSETAYYGVTTPAGNWSNVIFVRMNGSMAENIWTNRWNQTDDLEYNGINNLFTITDWHGGAANNSQGVWSVFDAVSEPSVTLNVPSMVYLGSSINLSATARHIENPTFVFFVKAPGSQNFVEITSPYTPAIAGTYTFRVEVAQTFIGFPPSPIADEKEVIVREFTIGDGITIGVRKPSDWENVAIYYWSDASSGWVIPVFYNDFYVYTFENENEVNIIFVNSDGTGFPTDADDAVRLGKQTVNIENIDESMCFEILDATHVDGDANWGKRRIRNIDCLFDTSTIVNTTESSVIFYVANNVLNVIFDGHSQIELFTISGQLIKSQQAQSPFNTPLNSGMYLLRVNGEMYKVMVK